MTEKKEVCILAIDELQMNLELIKIALEDKYNLLTASSKEEGFELLLSNKDKINLIILDIVLSGEEGLEFMERMKKQELNGIPVMVITSDKELKKEIQALQKGAVDFIRKPLYIEILENRVKNVLSCNRVEFDSLTGLYNRQKMFEETRFMLEENKGKKFAFIRYDINRFSTYNSIMGEDEGNLLLIEIANLLRKKSVEYEKKVYGRIGADIFCICELYNKALIEKHIKYTEEYFAEFREEYEITLSFGIYVFNDSSISIENMYTKASLAAHSCKGINSMKSYAYYENWMKEKSTKENRKLNDRIDTQITKFLHIYCQDMI